MSLAVTRSPIWRFAVVGVVMSGTHLLVFTALADRLVAELANVVAFLVVTQLNFVVSDRWTWSSRRVRGRSMRARLAQVVAFNATAASGFALNAVAFSVALRVLGLPATPSALVGIVAGAGATFLLSSRLVFRRAPAGSLPAST